MAVFLALRLAHALPLLCSCTVLVLARPVTANPSAPPASTEETRNAARELARDAVSAHDAGDLARALDLIDRAHSLVPAPTISIWQARIRAKMGKLIEANERYEVTRRAALEDDANAAFREAVRDAGREVEALRPRIPRIRVRVTGAGADSPSLRVTLDGKVVPPELVGVLRTVNPGAHQLEASVPGKGSARLRVVLAERERKDVELSLVSSASDSDSAAPAVDAADTRRAWSSRKTWGVVAASVGVAGVGAGVGFGLAANEKSSALEDSCDASRCPPSAREDLDAFRSRRTLAWVGYGVGAAGLATAAVLFFVVRDPPSKVGVRPFIAPGTAGLTGRF